MGEATERGVQKGKLIDELIHTEKVYTSNLGKIEKCFRAPLLTKAKKGGCGFTEEQVETIFSNVVVILNFHKIFCGELESRKITDSFLRNSDYLKLYTVYANQYEKSLQMLDKLRDNKKFQEHIREMRHNDETGRMDIMSFLIMPIQRIPRYEMLLGQLKKYTDEDDPAWNDLNECFEKVHEIATFVNDSKAKTESMYKMLKLQIQIKGCKFPLFKEGRSFLRDDQLIYIEDAKKYCLYRFILFNDILLWVSLKDNYEGNIKLEGVKLQKIAELPNCFKICCPPRPRLGPDSDEKDVNEVQHPDFGLAARDEVLMDQWFQAISGARDGVEANKESLSRAYFVRRESGVIHDRDRSSTVQSMNSCNWCNELCTNAQDYLRTSQGDFYHSACFRCDYCREKLKGYFQVRDGKNLHPECADKTAEVCEKCKKALKGACMTFNEKPYHTECFTCSTCANIIEGPFVLMEGVPVCKLCAERAAAEHIASTAKSCRKCKKMIIGTFISLEGMDLHQDCFICGVCKMSLMQTGPKKVGDALLCRSCFMVAEGQSQADTMSEHLRNTAAAIDEARRAKNSESGNEGEGEGEGEVAPSTPRANGNPTIKYCPQCGTQTITGSENFCSGCGFNLKQV